MMCLNGIILSRRAIAIPEGDLCDPDVHPGVQICQLNTQDIKQKALRRPVVSSRVVVRVFLILLALTKRQQVIVARFRWSTRHTHYHEYERRISNNPIDVVDEAGTALSFPIASSIKSIDSPAVISQTEQA